MKGSAAQLLYETLEAYKVTHLFGMDEPIQLYQVLDKKVIQPITVRDEKHGAIMAHGFAKATNRPGICTALRGPGATNLISGLAESFKSSTPVIAIVQELAVQNRGRNASSELDHDMLFKSVTKAVERIDSPNRAAEMARKAFRIATSGRPGPVVLLCPSDVMEVPVEAEVYKEVGCDRWPSLRVRASRESVVAASEMLRKSKKPVLIAGGGCIISQAWDQVVELAELLNAPVATTLMGKGSISDLHPLSVGVMGSATGGKFGRGRIANQIVLEADVAFIMGSRTDQIPYLDWSIPKKGTKILHLDIDPIEIGRNFETHVAMVGDVKETLLDLIQFFKETDFVTQSQFAAERVKRMREEWLKLNEPLANSTEIPIRPEKVLKDMSNFLDCDTIVVTDASFVSMWAMSHLDNIRKGCTFISPRGLAGLGWGLPAAMGVRVGDPNKTVICLTGDGAFGYVMTELETAARYNIRVITLVFNNSIWGFQKHYEEEVFGKSIQCDLSDVDYSSVARSLGCRGERVMDPEKIRGSLERAFGSEKPYVLDIVVDPRAIPPLTMFDEAIERGSIKWHH